MSATALGNSANASDGLKITKLFNVDGWVAIVTGGATGLGLTTATALAQNGARVYITGRRLEPLEEAARNVKPKEGKGELIPVQADISTKEGILKLKEEVEKREGWVNVLINNAGISPSCGKIDEVEQTPEAISEVMFGEDLATWQQTFAINTFSIHFTSSAFLPLLCAAKSKGGFPEPGNILNIASLSGITLTSQRGQWNYNSSKWVTWDQDLTMADGIWVRAAAIQLGQMMATEFARRGLGVRVNTINPGYFPSGMSVKEYGTIEGEEASALWKGKYAIPLGIMGSAQDYAQTVISTITNQYMTGNNILIDGGWMRTQAF